MKSLLFLVPSISLSLLAAPAAADTPVHRAVCVGVNRYDPSCVSDDSWLNGCVADASNLWTNLTERGEWMPANATLLLDAAAAPFGPAVA